MLKELLKSELTRLPVEITDTENQLTEVMAGGCGVVSGDGSCGTTSGKGCSIPEL